MKMETFIFEVQSVDPNNVYMSDVFKSLKEESRNVDICRLCLDLSELQPIWGIKFSKHINSLNFLEVELEFVLPEAVCTNCWKKLNEILLFIKRCKESYAIYSQMQKNCVVKESCSPDNQVNHVPFVEAIVKVEENDPEPSVEENVKTEDEQVKRKTEVEQVKRKTEVEKVKRKTEVKKVKRKTEVKKKILSNKHESKICYKCGDKITTFTEHYKLKKSCRPKNYECTDCNKCFKSGHDLGIHRKSNHDEVGFICHICSKSMKNPLSFRRHIREHTFGKIHICEICAKGFSRLAALNDHRNLHDKDRPIFSCKICTKKFSARSNLSSHLKIHMNGTTNNSYTVDDLTCKICNKTFSLLRSLKLHMKTHTDDRRYICRICHMCFDDARLHREHIRNDHLKERRFSCPECSKRFATRETLYTHSLTHKEPKHLCSACGRKFRLLSHLKRHLSLIHNVNKGEPFRCNFCTKTFNVRGNLTAHERIHTGEKPYVCHVCNMSFNASNARKKHVLKAHGEDEVKNIKAYV